jgi:hypothetical protein
MSVYDLAPTVLHIYGLPPLPSMKGRILTEIFEEKRQTARLTLRDSSTH